MSSPNQFKIPSPVSAFKEVMPSPPGSPATTARFERIRKEEGYQIKREQGSPNLFSLIGPDYFKDQPIQTAQSIAAMVSDMKITSKVPDEKEETTNHFTEKQETGYIQNRERLPTIYEADEEDNVQIGSATPDPRLIGHIYEEVPQWQSDIKSPRKKARVEDENG